MAADPEHEGASAGELMAAKMVENLALANRNAEKTQAMVAQVNEGIDELCGYFECLNRTMEILSDVARTKKKLTLDDFVGAWASASDDVWPDEDDGSDDDDDNDPPVIEPEPVGSGGRRI